MIRSVCIALSLLFVAGCISRTETPQPKANSPKEKEIEKPAAPIKPKLKESPLKKSKKNGLTSVEGFLDMARRSGGKRLQGTWLNTGSDELVLSYRPMPEYYEFVEKRVVVEGEYYHPEGQAIGATHFRVKSMKLAKGETPYAVKPTSLPVPPTGKTKEFLEERKKKWVQLVGTFVKEHEDPTSGAWLNIEIELEDKTRVVVPVWASEYKSRFNGKLKKGSVVTALGKCFVSGKTFSKMAPYALHRASICKGVVKECDLDHYPRPKGLK